MANILPFETLVRAIGALVEGCSIRAVQRMTGAHRDTIMRLGVRIGNACESLHNARMVDVQCSTVELDEAWSFIGKKRKYVTQDDPSEFGDCYLWVGLDANRKAIVSYRVGKRATLDARGFLADLRARVLDRPQITSDGYAPSIEAVWESFGHDCDFAQIIKLFQSTPGNEAAVRCSPGSIRGIEKRIVQAKTRQVEDFDLVRRMAKLDPANAYSSHDSTDKRILETLDEPQGGDLASRRVVQFLPRSRNAVGQPPDGDRNHRSRLEHRGTDRGSDGDAEDAFVRSGASTADAEAQQECGPIPKSQTTSA